jgi:hypothetical protein
MKLIENHKRQETNIIARTRTDQTSDNEQPPVLAHIHFSHLI